MHSTSDLIKTLEKRVETLEVKVSTLYRRLRVREIFLVPARLGNWFSWFLPDWEIGAKLVLIAEGHQNLVHAGVAEVLAGLQVLVQVQPQLLLLLHQGNHLVQQLLGTAAQGF